MHTILAVVRGFQVGPVAVPRLRGRARAGGQAGRTCCGAWKGAAEEVLGQNAGGCKKTAGGPIRFFWQNGHSTLKLNLGWFLGERFVYECASATIILMRRHSNTPKQTEPCVDGVIRKRRASGCRALPPVRRLRWRLGAVDLSPIAAAAALGSHCVTWAWAAWTLPRDSMTRGVGWRALPWRCWRWQGPRPGCCRHRRCRLR